MEQVPDDFESDGCTCVPDFYFFECCRVHDFRYSKKLSYKERLEADREFRECIKAHNHPYLAWVYYVGVRLFGWFFMYFPKKYKEIKEKI